MDGIRPLWDNMPVNPLNPISSQIVRPSQESQDAVSSFGSIFQAAIDAVRETDQEESKTAYLLSVGELDNPALLTIASMKAATAVDLLVQLRTKALDAYNEVMRITL